MYTKLLIAFLGFWQASALFAVSGFITISPGRNQSMLPAELTFSDGTWESTITLTINNKSHQAKQFSFIKGKDGAADQVIVGFADLPNAAADTVVILKGSCTKEKFEGVVLLGSFDATRSAEDFGYFLHMVLKSDENFGLKKHSDFSFYKGAPKPQGSVYAYPKPPTAYTKNGVPIYRGFAPSGDPSNPCPEGPCWTDAGVSRHLEFYAGPIQNPFHGRPASGFNRGVPNHMVSPYYGVPYYPCYPSHNDFFDYWNPWFRSDSLYYMRGCR